MSELNQIRGGDEMEERLKVLERYKKKLLAKQNVVGVAKGFKVVKGEQTDEECIVVMVEQKLPPEQLRKKDMVPREIEGIKTDVIETGVIRALNSPTNRWRPAPGGVSIGHFQITAGTLGCLVRRADETYILSNNHVLANSNDAKLGDPILQPGPYDGGRLEEDQIGVLSQFVPIMYELDPGRCPIGKGVVGLVNSVLQGLKMRSRLALVEVGEANKVDCAIAKPLKEEMVKREVLDIGEPAGIIEAEIGMEVKKSGRTTGLTEGKITYLNATVRVIYGQSKWAVFEDQIVTTPMSQGGDSGSSVFDKENRLCGLLFAGSDKTTVVNRIQNVFALLDVSL
jgi:hypothetical protein